MGPTQTGLAPGLVRNALGSLAVLSVVALIAVGLPALDRSMPAIRPAPAGEPYAIGAGVSIVPPEGASVDVSRTRPGEYRGTVLFLVEGVRFSVAARPHPGDLEQAADQLRSKITGPAGFQVTGSPREARTEQGVPGVRGTYLAPGRVGEYAVFVHDALAVEATASGPETALREVSPRLDASLGTIAFPTDR